MNEFQKLYNNYNGIALKKFEDLPNYNYIFYPGGSQYEITSTDGYNYIMCLNEIIDEIIEINELSIDTEEEEFSEEKIKNKVKELKTEFLERLESIQDNALEGILDNIEINERINDFGDYYEYDENLSEKENENEQELSFQWIIEELQNMTKEVLEDIFDGDKKEIEKLLNNIKVHLYDFDYAVIWSNYKIDE